MISGGSRLNIYFIAESQFWTLLKTGMRMDEAKDILEGFNAGYIIQQHRPKLFAELQTAIKEIDLPFFDALAQGGKEYSQERLKPLFAKKEWDLPTKSEEYPEIDGPDIDVDM